MWYEKSTRKMEKNNYQGPVNGTSSSQMIYDNSSNTDCFLQRIPIELLDIITGIVKEETLKLETVGYRFKNQLFEWSEQTDKNKVMTLLYKGTCDGFIPDTFHAKCDNKGETWTIIQDVGGYIFGGYTSVPWTSKGGNVIDPRAFIFTLVNPHGIPRTKYKYIQRSDSAEQCSHQDKDKEFPSFGGGFFPDILISSHPDSKYPSRLFFPDCYCDTTGKGDRTFTQRSQFKSKEIEVWGLNYKQL